MSTSEECGTRTGEEAWALAFVRAYTAHPSDDCIRWTHTITSNGYGRAGRMYVNAAHLEAVPGRENKRRANAANWRPTCVHGHPKTPENTITRNGRDFCLPCRRARSAKQAAEAKAARRAAREATA